MKICVTGGSGFIGQRLIAEYGDIYEFIVPTRQSNHEFLCPKAKYITIQSIEDIKGALIGCQSVIHLASNVMHGMDEDMSVNKYAMNADISEKLFSACREMGIYNIVNASSVAVYDQIDETPMSEEGPCQPNSMYGVMKLAAEKIAEIYNRRYDMKIKSLRFAQGVGIASSMNPNSFWTMLIENSYNGIDIPVYGEGRTGRDIIYVKDMAHALVSASSASEISGVFNIGLGKIISNMDLAVAFSNGFQKGSKIIKINHPESGIRTCMNIEKARKILGFEPRYSLEDMVEEIKKEYTESKNR